MKAIWKKTAAAALAGLFMLAAAGCGSGEKKNSQKEILKVGVAGFADNLESASQTGGLTVIRYGLGETLAKFGKDMQVVPWLAESWKVGADKLTWTFTVNDKAMFSNGNKVTAEAVKSSIERTLSLSVEASDWARIDSMKAEGQTLTVRTKTPLPGLPGVFCDPRFSIVDTSVRDRDIPHLGPVCTGPYTVKSFARDKTVMEANSHYWKGPVPFKGVEILSFDDPHTRAMALKKGEVDVAAGISSGDLNLFKDANAFRISERNSLNSVLARLNIQPGRPLADQRIREALAFCLNRPAYCKVLLRDTFIPGGPVLAPGLGYGYNELMQLDACRRDVAKSKKLLKEAGWKDTNGDGIVDKGGKNLEIGFTIYTSQAELPLLAEAVKADARNVGIKINIKAADYNAVEQAEKSGDYDMLIHTGMTLQAGSPQYYMNMYWKSNTNGNNPHNTSGYSNVKFDALSEALSVEPDPAKQKQMTIDMQKILLEDTAVIVFGYPKTNIISSAAIANADIMPCDYYWITGDWQRSK